MHEGVCSKESAESVALWHRRHCQPLAEVELPATYGSQSPAKNGVDPVSRLQWNVKGMP